MRCSVGLFVSHASNHKHAHYIIRNSEHLLGFAPAEVEIIALLARYHRCGARTAHQHPFCTLACFEAPRMSPWQNGRVTSQCRPAEMLIGFHCVPTSSSLLPLTAHVHSRHAVGLLPEKAREDGMPDAEMIRTYEYRPHQQQIATNVLDAHCRKSRRRTRTRKGRSSRRNG